MSQHILFRDDAKQSSANRKRKQMLSDRLAYIMITRDCCFRQNSQEICQDGMTHVACVP